MDRLEDLANTEVDLTRIAPAVADFFERTAELELRIQSRWRLPFKLFYALTRPLLALFGQLVLPLSSAVIRTSVHALTEGADGRPSARAVIRRYAVTERVMQVVSYAVWTRDGQAAMSACFPLPFGQLLGILRLENSGERGAVLNSTQRNGDDAGVWVRLFGIAVRAPFSERLELQPATGEAPEDFPNATLEGTHEQRLFGVLVVRHAYWFRAR